MYIGFEHFLSVIGRVNHARSRSSSPFLRLAKLAWKWPRYNLTGSMYTESGRTTCTSGRELIPYEKIRRAKFFRPRPIANFGENRAFLEYTQTWLIASRIWVNNWKEVYSICEKKSKMWNRSKPSQRHVHGNRVWRRIGLTHAYDKFSQLFFSETKSLVNKFYSIFSTYFHI